jgi:hypothetical protein
MATDHHHSPRASHGEDGAGPLNHEPTDISLEGIGKLTIGFVVILLVVSATMYGAYRLLDRRAIAADAAPSKIDKGYGRVDVAGAPLMNAPNALETGGRPPAGPKMLTNEPLWLRDVRAGQLAAATTYGWADKGAGVVRVPIERAKQLILEHGLPATAAPAAAAEPAAAAPDPATPPAATTPAATPPAAH